MFVLLLHSFRRNDIQTAKFVLLKEENYALLYTNACQNATRREATFRACDPSVGLAWAHRHARAGGARFALISES